MEEPTIPQRPLQQQEEDRQAPTATDDRQEPVMEELMIQQSPPHVQGPPPQDGVGSPLPPEVEANRDADCQDQLAQQPLLQVPPHLQGPEYLHPLHDGAESPPPPAVGNIRPRHNTRRPDRYTDADVHKLVMM